jgi:hypothetical protein
MLTDPQYTQSSIRQGQVADLAQRLPLRQATFDLLGMSFGAAEGYVRRGGQRVIADESTPSTSHDIAAVGLDLPRDLGRGRRATGAFTIGSGKIQIRARLAIDIDSACRGFVRAWAGKQLRVVETAVDFRDGQAEVDLPVTGIPTHTVQTVDELWTWECRVEGSDYSPIEIRYGGSTIDAFPIRLYFTAGVPINALPRESFYHVACAAAGATNPMQAERDVWAHFTAFRMGRFVTNARGQRLGFWRDRKPGVGQADVISRTADDLIRLTDSSCRGWAELFREALAIHGISSIVRAVQPKLSLVHPRLGLPMFLVPDGRGGNTVTRTVGILVKPFRWKPAEEISPFPFSAEQAVVNPGRFLWKIDNPVDPFTAHWPQPDAEDLLRSGHTAPDEGDSVRGVFGNHAVVLVQRPGGVMAWYDPSFGLGPHNSLLDYENDLLGRGEENPGGLFAIIGWKRQVNHNPVTGQMQESSDGLLLGAAPAPPGPVLEALDPS